MELTREADYAVRVVVELASRPPAAVVPSRTVAQRQQIPRAFLAKVVARLARVGFVKTFRGSGGGLQLARPPAEITLRQVVEAIEGPIRLNRCLREPGACPLQSRCQVHGVWRRIQELLLRELDAVTIAQLARPARQAAGPAASGRTAGESRARRPSRAVAGAPVGSWRR